MIYLYPYRNLNWKGRRFMNDIPSEYFMYQVEGTVIVSKIIAK